MDTIPTPLTADALRARREGWASELALLDRSALECAARKQSLKQQSRRLLHQARRRLRRQPTGLVRLSD